MLTQTRKHSLTPTERNQQKCAETKINANTHASDVRTKTHTFKTSFGTHVFWQVGALRVNIVPMEKKEKRARVSALESDGGWQQLSWEHDRDYRRSKSVMGPSSLSPTISAEAPGISLPNITGSQASSIKLTLNGLIGSRTYDCESIRVGARERERRREPEKHCAI